MRTFPNIWVPPGGSIDWDEESLFAAGLRELQEETNLQFADEDIVSCKPLCMWESMYPTMLSKGIYIPTHLLSGIANIITISTLQLANNLKRIFYRGCKASTLCRLFSHSCQ